MNKLIKKIVALILLCLLIFSLWACQPSPDKNITGAAYSIDISNGDVYIAGYYNHDGYYYDDYTVAVYWKNDDIIELDGYEAKEVFVDGDDVYVIGEYSLPNGQLKKCYWKNKIRFDLDEEITSMYVHNGDIYTTGQYYNDVEDRNYACYWKNGIRVELNEGLIALGIYVEGNDVLVYGEKGWRNYYWINGQVNQVDEDIEIIKDAYIKDGNYYLTGLFEPEHTNEFYYPCYWINGVRQSIYMGVDGGIDTIYEYVNIYEENGNIHLIAMDGGNVFHWKNTEFIERFDSGYPEASYYYDNDLYTVGFYFKKIDEDNIKTPCYWVNGIFIELSY
jgi:hypothetical protein